MSNSGGKILKNAALTIPPGNTQRKEDVGRRIKRIKKHPYFSPNPKYQTRQLDGYKPYKGKRIADLKIDSEMIGSYGCFVRRFSTLFSKINSKGVK